MGEYQVQIWFLIICTVIFVIQQLGHWQQHLSEERDKVANNRSRVDRIIDSADLEQIRMEVALLVALTIGEPVQRIELDVDFKEDLRVPPGDMHVLFDEVDESFRVELERSEIATFRDLLQQICEQRSS